MNPHSRLIARSGCCILLFAALFVGGAAADTSAEKEEWITLFNGRDLSGWTPKITGHVLGDNFGNTFRVEDGLLKVRYDQYKSFGSKFGHLFYKDSFSYYRLVVEYRFVGEQAPGGPGTGPCATAARCCIHRIRARWGVIRTFPFPSRRSFSGA